MHPIILRGTQVVIAAFALFGGFIGDVSPPDHMASTGMASLLALVLFVWIVGTTGGQSVVAAWRQVWLAVAGGCFVAALILFVIYFPTKATFVWQMPSGQDGVGGLWYSAEALKAIADEGVSSPSDVLALFGGPAALYQVWPVLSHWLAAALLYLLYALCVLTSLGALFAISEGIFGPPAPPVPVPAPQPIPPTPASPPDGPPATS